MIASQISASRPQTPTFEGLSDSNETRRIMSPNTSRPSLSLNDDTTCLIPPDEGEKSKPFHHASSEERLRRKLALFFMDPVRKFIARKQTPWKLFVQLLKILLVTCQLLIFGEFGYEHTNYFEDNKTGFDHLFVKDWDPAREVNAYPPSTGPYAIYKRSEFYEFFDNAANTYHSLDKHVVNPLYKNSSFTFCIESFIGVNETTPVYDSHKERFVTNFSCIDIPEKHLGTLNSTEYLTQKDFNVPWFQLEKMFINFTLRTITFRKMGSMMGPACFLFGIRITFDNSDHDGQILVTLTTKPQRYQCPQSIQLEASVAAVGNRLLDTVVIVVCLVSLVLCGRALFRAQILCTETRRYFKDNHSSDLCAVEQFQFLNLWYVMICINDVLIILGSVLKEMIDLRETSGDIWNYCSIFLGCGSLLVWIGMLRYFTFFKAYNALILTLKGALPNVFRFFICSGMIFLGYTICGWVVLGPYHYKFRTLESTIECLFSLMNGDDMFATFNMINGQSLMITSFSKFYSFSFIMLFIYVILSLSIAIIMDAYEAIKEFYKNGFPKSRVDQFYTAVNYDIYSDTFIDGHKPSNLYRLYAYIMIKIEGDEWPGYKRETANENTFDTTPIPT